MEADRIIGAFREEIATMKGELQDLKAFLTTRDERISGLETTLSTLQAENAKLQTRMTSLEGKLDATEAYERRDTIIISGSIDPATTGEITKNVVVDLVKRKLGGLTIQPSDISVAHRLQTRPNTQNAKPPNIYVKLCRRDLKKELIYASKQQDRNSNTRILVYESLTPKRTAIFRTLVNMKKHDKDLVKGVTSHEGQVVAFTPGTQLASGERGKDRRHYVNTREQLQKFCEEFVRQPLEDFIVNWSDA